MSELNENPLEIQVSSTTLGHKGEGGKVGGMTALAEEVVSKDRYTQTVIENAERFKKTTEQEVPDAKFGVSVLASAVNPEQMKDLMGSVDYPYLIKWGPEFLKEKWNKVTSEGQKGLGAGISLGQELAHAMLQSSSDKGQIVSTIKAGEVVPSESVKIRTCIETVSISDELNKIKAITGGLENKGKDVTWVIEPNKKVGDGTIVDFLNRFEKLKKSYPTLSFGIDLDMGGLPKEDRNLYQLLDMLDDNQLVPIYLSLSGREYQEGEVRSHLPLGENSQFNRGLGYWYSIRSKRGQKLPGIVVETSPAQGNVLKDYQKFLSSFKEGLG